MAQTYTKAGANGYSAKLVLSESTVNAGANQSTVHYTLYLISTNYSFSAWEVRRNFKIDGSTIASNATQMSIGDNSTLTVLSGSKVVNHNSDGSKTISISALCETSSSSYTPGSITVTGTFKLTDIPRKSSFGGLSQRNIGTPMTLSINRASSSFTHKVWYHMPGQSWVLIGSGYGTTCNFTIPLSSCSYLPNSTSGRCDFCIETFNGSTSLGSTYGWYTVNVPSSVVPVINSVALTERNTAVSSIIDKWVQSVSMIRIAATTSMSYGATTSSIDILFQGKHYPQWTVDTNITQSGTLPIKVTVKDSRGRTAVYSTSIAVLPYVNPQITNLSIIRANAQGDSDVLGTTAKVSFNSAITSITSNGVEKNIRRVKIERLNNSPEVLFDAVVPELGGALSKLYMPYDIALSYEFKVTVSDIFGRANKLNIILPKGIVTMHMGDDAIGVGTLLSGDTHNIEAGSKGILTNGKLTQRQGTDEVEFSLSQAFIDKWKNLLSGGVTLERLLLEVTHPVGSYYWSSDSKNPGEIFGGTWEQIKDKFVFAAGSKAVNITGGEEKHTLITEEMPSHSHTLRVNLNGGGGYFGYPSGSVNPPNWIDSSSMMSTVGGSQPHNNMPPYIVAYCWRRTA